jgi:P pilus assembly chaperone PapD
MRNIRTATSIIVIALVLVLILASTVSAGLRVSGTKIQDALSPGEVQTYVMNVGNTTNEPMDITVAVMGLGNYLSGTIRELTESNDGPLTARTFITATPISFHLEPGQSQDVTVTINMPVNVGDGGRYADIFIYTAPSGGGQIGVSVAVSAQVLLTIEGSTPTISGDITSIDIPQAVSEQLFSATATLQNTGNYHYKIRYNGTVKNSLDQIVGTAWQTDSVDNLIPTFSQRIAIPLNISQELTPGTYSLEIEAYTQDGILLDTGSKTFVLTDLYKPMLLRPLLVEFWDTGKLSMYQWDMSEDGTLMENVDATSLASSVNLLIRQGTKVLWSEGQSTNNIAVTLVDPSPPPGYDIVRAFDFSPDGITFDPKAYITFEYSPADVQEGVSETQLKVATFDEDTLQWIILEGDDVEVDTDANTITFPVTHFSVYAIVAPPPASPTTIAGIDKQTWIWIGIGALWVVVLTFAIGMIQRRRSQISHKNKNKRRRLRVAKPQAPTDKW